MFLITKDWLHQFKAGGGGWNQVQFGAIGIEWPPEKGWIEEANGFGIPEEHRRIFEESVGLKMSMKQKRKLAKKLIDELTKWRGDGGI